MIDDVELPIDETHSPAPGVFVQRRSFLATAAAAIALAPTASAHALRHRTSSREAWTIEEFVERVVPIAKELVADGSSAGQDRYLHTVASYAARLGEVPMPEKANEISPARHWIGSNFAGEPFVVLHWKLAPGAVIRPHPHIYGNVVTFGIAGETRLRNYEVVGQPDFDAKKPFRVQLTVDQTLRPGDINLVNLDRNYIHGFEAGAQEARGLDITTRIRPKRPTPSLAIAAEPADAARRLYDASWE